MSRTKTAITLNISILFKELRTLNSSRKYLRTILDVGIFPVRTVYINPSITGVAAKKNIDYI